MTLEQFTRNNRGINDGEDLPYALQEELYNSIVSNAIKLQDSAAGKANHANVSPASSSFSVPCSPASPFRHLPSAPSTVPSALMRADLCLSRHLLYLRFCSPPCANGFWPSYRLQNVEAVDMAGNGSVAGAAKWAELRRASMFPRGQLSRRGPGAELLDRDMFCLIWGPTVAAIRSSCSSLGRRGNSK